VNRGGAAIGGAALVAAAVSALLFGGKTASATATYESPYGYGRTWNAAVRLVRVDNGWKVTEKDDAAGYLLFEYRSPENTRPSPGSIEIVRGPDADAPVSVLAALPQMPHYHEQLLLDSLASKMRREYGEPPRSRKAPPGETDAGGD
jgi:hypothetical protein